MAAEIMGTGPGKMGPVIRFVRLALPAVLAGAALAGCGGSPAPAAPSTALTGDEAAFVARARSVAPRIVGDDERLAARAGNTCASISDGRPASAAVEQAVQRFSSGSYTVTVDEAVQLVEAARATVCATG